MRVLRWIPIIFRVAIVSCAKGMVLVIPLPLKDKNGGKEDLQALMAESHKNHFYLHWFFCENMLG